MTVYDAIVVGAGAGGSAAAYHMVQLGMRVLLIERASSAPSGGGALDGNGLPERITVGGATPWRSAALPRFAPTEFGADRKHDCLPWPVSYDDLAPFYEEAEQLLAVRTYPMEPDLQRIILAVCNGDQHWRRQALSVQVAGSVPGSALLDRLRFQPNLQVLTGRTVTALLPSSGGLPQAGGVQCDDGTLVNARSVVVAAGALHSPRLLRPWLDATGLASRIPGHRLVGCNYKHQFTTLVVAFSPSRKTDRLHETVLLLSDDFPHSSVHNIGSISGERVTARRSALMPRWLHDLAGAHACGFRLTTEDGSHPDNRVENTAGSLPRIHYDPARAPAGLVEHRRLVRAFRLDLLKAGCLTLAQRMPVEETGNACGTLLAGHDPGRSVVDPDGRVHGADNVYVADASVLARSGRVNPALTVYAWGLRVASRLSVH